MKIVHWKVQVQFISIKNIHQKVQQKITNVNTLHNGGVDWKANKACKVAYSLNTN